MTETRTRSCFYIEHDPDSQANIASKNDGNNGSNPSMKCDDVEDVQGEKGSSEDSDVEEDAPCENLLEYIDLNVIGHDTVFEGPFGLRTVIYCDYTASGRPLKFIEEYIMHYVYALYANTHTTTSITSRQTTQFRHEARDIIKKCVNASEQDVVIFTGSGTTGAIHKLISALQLNNNMTAYNTVVIVGPYEHHSNILPWKESGVRKIVRIPDTSKGQVDLYDLERQLQTWKEEGLQIITAFSAASNVTGIVTDTVAVGELVHKYGGLCFWDYATAAPYLKIDMNPTETGYKDAMFCSPHKFVGGPGSPGVLIAKKHLFRNPVPHGCGGGTVLFVTRDTHLYLQDIEMREEGGTPAIIESIRAGMVFQLKHEVGTDVIEEREDELCRKAFAAWKRNPNMRILGSHTSRRLPIFAFLVFNQETGKFLHHNFISVLLNDLYGIQARGGCACAGPYAQDLLGIDEDMAREFTEFLSQTPKDGETTLKQALEIMKPGFVRLNLPYFFPDDVVDFVLDAVDMVCTYGWKLLPQKAESMKDSPLSVMIDEEKLGLVWFVEPREAYLHLAISKLSVAPKPGIPFQPRSGSRKVVDEDGRENKQLRASWKRRRYSPNQMSFWMKHGQFHTHDACIVARVQEAWSTGHLPVISEDSKDVYVLGNDSEKLTKVDPAFSIPLMMKDHASRWATPGTISPHSGQHTPVSDDGSPKVTRSPRLSVDVGTCRPLPAAKRKGNVKCPLM
ncbi:PREDICTED: probable cysteine desulfurase isoform X2 [Priapulus caudatus]|uniref:Probable cysteine desulfurase isoform X2 n=1 Tax=Priapulus caudatus TaxID=37621 RepID=A0ABM1DNA8_PRICU|nr:PREDICTED: probable cysteine desulfurase isoform X2 [Priapulus caudatus]